MERTPARGDQLTNIVKELTEASARVCAEVILDLRLIDPSAGEVIYSAKGEREGGANWCGRRPDQGREVVRRRCHRDHLEQFVTARLTVGAGVTGGPVLLFRPR